MGAEILAGLIRAELAASAAILAVMLLRRPIRLTFGARAAYGLWVAPPLAAVASLLPARVERVATTVEGVPASPAPALAFGGEAAGLLAAPALDPVPWLLGLWVLGVVVVAVVLAGRQRRFMRTLGPLTREAGHIFRAAAAGVGPAVVGGLRPKLVLPADFETHFSREERQVVIAHEAAHLACGDPWINAATAAAQCLSWFNPLVHMAAFHLRLDQELACDAAVVERFPQERRRYAETMLKTQLAPLSLPIGCYWPARATDPLKARIAMLKLPSPGAARRGLGAALALGLSLGGGYACWAAQPPRLVAEHRDTEAGQRRAGGRALIAAAYRQDHRALERLLAQGVDPNFEWRGKGTALVVAAYGRDLAAVDLLLARGANPNLASPGTGSPLLAAAARGDLVIMRRLLASGADPNLHSRGDGTPLITAARRGDLAAMKLLVDSGGDPNFATRGEGSPLYAATRTGHWDAVRFLKDYGATH